MQAGMNDGPLKNEYRMQKQSILKLYRLLKPQLRTHARNRQGDVFDPLSKILMALRYFMGLRYVDICRIRGVSRSSVFSSIKQVVGAISRHPDIGKPQFPTDEAEAKVYATEWDKLSGPSD